MRLREVLTHQVEVQQLDPLAVLRSFAGELETIRAYCNDAFYDIAFTYNSSVQYRFDYQFRFAGDNFASRAKKSKAETSTTSELAEDTGAK
jgi:hypothetical protein